MPFAGEVVHAQLRAFQARHGHGLAALRVLPTISTEEGATQVNLRLCADFAIF